MEYRLAKISGLSVGPRPVTNTKSWASESKRLGTPGLDGVGKQFTARTVGGAMFVFRRPANQIAKLKNKDGRPNSVDGRICT